MQPILSPMENKMLPTFDFVLEINIIKRRKLLQGIV